MSDDAGKEARAKAQDLLAGREHSRLELERKLTARGFGSAVVAEVLDALERERLLSQTRFIEQFVYQRARRGQGPLKILRELGQRGISEDQAGEFLDPGDSKWSDAARAALEKKFGVRPPRAYKERARQTRFLEQRGFTHEQIRRALAAADEETDEDQ